MGKGSVLIVQLFAVCLVLISAGATETIYAFSARAGTLISYVLRNETIVFPDVITNAGNAYSRSTGVYICPVSGLYQFMVTIASGFLSATETELIAGGEIEMHTYSTGLDRTSSGSNTVLLYLNAGDEVYVRAHSEIYVSGRTSSFSGLLIQAI